ncbi:hypothetical protein [Pseudonocardia broussonetiae]|uniref:Secreted protein n=1 Tax=Pseudonocardia broussonetiae TaxID=2736640 RepID=A0A6M6JB40_9PSEU|nr:hypothetical protein [Pseudonocardia broussonetiae]QJY45158.1 hypothetical protein HOP40_04385 [Pseudonocardia broussonetiae]
MSTAKRITLATAAGALLLLGAGVAAADEDSNAGYPSTQNPGQVGSSVTAILGELTFQGTDALNGDNRPDGANGVENEFPPVDPRYVEGPVGGLLNGPFD